MMCIWINEGLSRNQNSCQMVQIGGFNKGTTCGGVGRVREQIRGSEAQRETDK